MLAAGRSTRFGSTKQLAQIDGRPMVARTADLARQACGDNTVLVAGHEWNRVHTAAAGACRFLVVNERFADGMGTSIAAGVAAVSHVADAVLILLADQVAITGAHIDLLVRAWRKGAADIVATAFDDVVGPPVIFGRAAFGKLVALNGDQGARSVIEDGDFDVMTIVSDLAAIDIDTPTDLSAPTATQSSL